MAPIVVSSSGIPRQVIDDPDLRLFLERLKSLAGLISNEESGQKLPVDLDALTTELQRVPRWRFQEQVCANSYFLISSTHTS